MILGSCRGHLRRAHAPAVESNEVRVMALRQSLEDPRHLMTVKEVTTLWFKCQPKLLDICSSSRSTGGVRRPGPRRTWRWPTRRILL